MAYALKLENIIEFQCVLVSVVSFWRIHESTVTQMHEEAFKAIMQLVGQTGSQFHQACHHHLLLARKNTGSLCELNCS